MTANSLPSNPSQLLGTDGIRLLNEIQNILVNKAPEAIPLFDELLQTLSRARRLRSIPAFQNIFIRKSMTKEERVKESDLRRQASERNAKEHGVRRFPNTYGSYFGRYSLAARDNYECPFAATSWIC
ncbi:unnamed protein product [Nippostrongylus brasiliensis]|uniref:Uncharacterized protein n=1 Tax=Nippostrongylus brasiliensis TaxID=27835 RepID=A0A0N4XY94_NIPBR|nr:unnamed protein product [Nippostrongylus brasiliensis]